MTADFWDKRARKYDDAVQRHDAVFDRTVASVKTLLSTSDVVLDLGCASGEYGLETHAPCSASMESTRRPT